MKKEGRLASTTEEGCAGEPGCEQSTPLRDEALDGHPTAASINSMRRFHFSVNREFALLNRCGQDAEPGAAQLASG